jgi:hypothetical protein
MTVLWEKADLIVTGSRGLSREEKEFTVVSVSRRIASRASLSSPLCWCQCQGCRWWGFLFSD